MSWMRRKTFALVAASLAAAAMLGGTLGIAMAGTANLGSGFQLVGGPTLGDVPPAQWISCVTPNTAWKAVYIWDAPNQQWKHYFNTNNGVPAYVNQTASGGISVIPRFAGVALIMNQPVNGAKLLDGPNQSCS